MTYDLDFLDTGNNTIDLVTGVNNVTEGALFPVILISFSIIFIMVSIGKENFKGILLANGFITTILGVLLWGSGLASWYVVIYPIILLFSSIMLVTFGKD